LLLAQSPQTLFMTAFVDGLVDYDEKLALSKKHTQLKTRVQKPYPDQNGQNLYPIYDRNS